MLLFIITFLVVLSAAANILAEYRKANRLKYVSKPLTVILIILIGVLGRSSEPYYKYMIIAGLSFSLVGDVFLMLPKDRFIEGLAAFLIAHLFYIAAFGSLITDLRWWPLIPLLIFGIGVYVILAPGLADTKFPVSIYLLVIMVMAWLAWEHWLYPVRGGAFLAFTGAVLFVISDTILAIDRFRSSFRPARALILATYFAAQWLIAVSIDPDLIGSTISAIMP